MCAEHKKPKKLLKHLGQIKVSHYPLSSCGSSHCNRRRTRRVCALLSLIILVPEKKKQFSESASAG